VAVAVRRRPKDAAVVAEYSKFIAPFVLILFVVGLFFIKQPRIQVEEIGRRPWWVGVMRETGQPDCVALAPADSGYDHCLLDLEARHAPRRSGRVRTDTRRPSARPPSW